MHISFIQLLIFSHFHHFMMNESIDSTTKVVDNFSALPLDKNKWIEYIEKVKIVNNKRDFDGRLIVFDINENINSLKEIYQKGLKK